MSGVEPPAEQGVPLVSVIIPNYNRERSIGLCLASVRAQTHPRVETIVVDDCSTDDSPRIARDAGVPVLRTGGNLGPPAARNLGAAAARGDILFFLDSDVALEPDAIAQAVRALRADERLGVVTGLLAPEPLLRRTRVQEYRAMQLHCWFYRIEGPTLGFAIHTAMFAVRREVYDEVGPLNPRLRHHDGAEYGGRLNRHGYAVHASAAIRGRKDSDATLRVMLTKVFNRSRAHALERDPEVPLAGTSGRVVASALVLAGTALLPLPLLVGAGGLLVPVAVLGASLALDATTLRFVLARRGLAFTGYFAGLHLLLNLTSAAGGALGVLRRLVSRPPATRARVVTR